VALHTGVSKSGLALWVAKPFGGIRGPSEAWMIYPEMVGAQDVQPGKDRLRVSKSEGTRSNSNISIYSNNTINNNNRYKILI
jgi:hypothetical protein